MIKYDTIKQLDDQFVMHTYNRFPALFVQGAGCSLWDNRGNEYLDLLAGIAVCGLGHCHPAVVAAITRQAQQLMHVSNALMTAPPAQLARRLCEISGMEKVFFSVCGTTANETGIKIAKKHGKSKRPNGDYEIVVLKRSFHGRTLGSLSGTMQDKYQRPFDPLLPGFVAIEANDIEALRAVVGPQTAAILVEPIQGEGGVRPLTTEFAMEARELADQFDALLMFDEVQTGMGRTGHWFAFQMLGVTPDVLLVAKALGGGMPIGACLTRGKAASILEVGQHGSTFGGNPLMCAAGLAVIDTIEHQDLLEHTQRMGDLFRSKLGNLGKPIKDVRGAGLMIGVELSEPIAREVVAKAFDQRLIINATDEQTLRFVPPLIISERQIDMAIDVLAGILGIKAAAVAVPSTEPPAAPRDYLSVDDYSNDLTLTVLDHARFLKERRKMSAAIISPIENRSVAMVFEKPSLRTRVTFETAVRELGGYPIHLTKADIGLGEREAVKDVASNLSRWCSMIVARLYWHKQLEELAAVSDVPIVNALTEYEHPCQALADLMTIRENFGEEKVKIVYVGDGNNVARSLAKLGARLGYPVTILGPDNFRLEDLPGVEQTDDFEAALHQAKVIYTDVWISMGDEREQEHRLKVFEPYQVNSEMLRLADPEAIFMHCLPARRGYEVTDDVMDGPHSRVVDQAENRLHAQKALLMKMMGLL